MIGVPDKIEQKSTAIKIPSKSVVSLKIPTKLEQKENNREIIDFDQAINNYYQTDIVKIKGVYNDNSFYHSVLTAFYPDYMNTSDSKIHNDIVNKFKNEISDLGTKNLYFEGDQYEDIAKKIGINIIVLEEIKKDKDRDQSELIGKFDFDTSSNINIILFENKNNYDTIGIRKEIGIQTVFFKEDKFLSDILNIFG